MSLRKARRPGELMKKKRCSPEPERSRLNRCDHWLSTNEIGRLTHQRETYRRSRRFEEADVIYQRLSEAGVTIDDNNFTWRCKNGRAGTIACTVNRNAYAGSSLFVDFGSRDMSLTDGIEKKLETYFSQYGEVRNVRLRSRRPNTSRDALRRYFAFVEFAQARAAISAIDTPSHVFEGEPIGVQYDRTSLKHS